MPSFFVAAATPVVGFSQKNSGECTPTMVKPALAYLPCQSRNCGITFWQLIQPWVQNSTSTTRPRSQPMVSGGLLSHGAPAMSGAARPERTCTGATPAESASPHTKPDAPRQAAVLTCCPTTGGRSATL